MLKSPVPPRRASTPAGLKARMGEDRYNKRMKITVVNDSPKIALLPAPPPPPPPPPPDGEVADDVVEGLAAMGVGA